MSQETRALVDSTANRETAPGGLAGFLSLILWRRSPDLNSGFERELAELREYLARQDHPNP